MDVYSNECEIEKYSLKLITIMIEIIHYSFTFSSLKRIGMEIVIVTIHSIKHMYASIKIAC